MNNPKRYIVLMAFVISTLHPLLAGHKEGNGGDHVRATFLKVGEAVIHFLSTSQEGTSLVRRFNLDLDVLTDTLDIHKIEVTDKVLLDNGGAMVDAVGKLNKITLHRTSWIELFDDQVDVYYLVFHEMLRSGGYNDDNYRISGNLNPFPISLKLYTRISPVAPLIDGDISKVFPPLTPNMLEGTHCGSVHGKNVMELDLEKNTLDVSTPEFNIIGGTSSDRWLADGGTCRLSVPIQLPVNKKLIITQVDISGRVGLPLNSKIKMALDITDHGKVKTYEKITSVKANKTYGRVQLRVSQPFETQCGERTNLNLRTLLEVKVPGRTMGYAGVSGIKVYFRLDDCNFLSSTSIRK